VKAFQDQERLKKYSRKTQEKKINNIEDNSPEPQGTVFFFSERQVVASLKKTMHSPCPSLSSHLINSHFITKPKRRLSCGFVPVLAVSG
jgi:hypothetical protein